MAMICPPMTRRSLPSRRSRLARPRPASPHRRTAARLSRYACGCRCFEQLPARHADDAGVDAPLGLELLVGLHAERHLTAGGQQQHVRLAAGGVRRERRAPLVSPERGCCTSCGPRSAALPAGSGIRATGFVLELCMISFHASTHSFGVAGPHRHQARGHGAQRKPTARSGWCVGPSFADTNRVVGKDIDDRDFHDRRQADRIAAIVG